VTETGLSFLDTALAYAARSWRVFPCHTPTTAGGCSCRQNCGRTGKHPRTKNGLKDATTDTATIQRWWRQFPQANIAIATGAVSGLVVLDEDTYKGGDRSRIDLERTYQPLPETVQQLTGGGGVQYVFAHPGTHVKNGVETFGPGLDIRGDGGYVIVPPSLHASGKRYAWEVSHLPDETPLAPMPPWLLTLCQETTRREAPSAGEPIPQGRRNNTLFQLGCSFRARGCTEAVILAALREMNTTQCQPPLDEAEVATIAVSCAQYPAGQAREDANQRRNGAASAPEPDLPPEPVWPQCAPEAFYGLAGEIVNTIAPHTESDPVAILGQLLVMVGNAINRAPYFPVEADRHYPNVFICLVGATSKGRKGTSAGYPRRLLGEIDPAWKSRVKGGLSSGEGVIWNVRDAVSGKNKKGEEVCEDEGESDKRLCILESEFARALAKTAQDGNVLSAVLRQAWDTGDLNTLVSGRSKSPVQATGAHISVIAHITADELRRTLTEVEAANGFGNRFLWLCVRRSQLLPEGGNYPDRALAPLREQLAQAILAARQVARMTRSDAARLLWRDIYTALAEGAPGLVGALTARAEAQVLRLSMLYALCNQSAVIDVPHLQAAYALWQYCEASARYVFGEALGDPLADSMLQMLRYAGSAGLTRTDINHELGRHVKSAAIGQALVLLRREEFARPEVEKTSGRPIERWFACTSVSHPSELSEKSEIRSLGGGTATPSMPLNSLNSHTHVQEREVFDV